MKQLADRVAVITGAGGGIGSALARNLASRGCKLALVDRDTGALRATAETLAPTGIQVSQHVVDISDRAQMAALPDAVVGEHGQVNLLINNAGITYQKSFTNHSIEDWETVTGVNYWGVVYGCHYFLPALQAAGEAHIVNLSSMNALAGLPSQSSYCATKAAVKLLSESLWSELRPLGIGVTTVHPGAIRTDMMQATLDKADDQDVAQKTYDLVQRIGMDPERAASKIVAAVQRRRMRVRVGADAVLVDILKRCFPVGLHHLLAKLG
ncbi:MAG: SDR family oxidoreductase [Halioglobus sp.]|nr:SDR family oxidoreductase [Halioglobus sp.]|tara:strand:+ start:557 stop:1357 length:801 start_codon:yes stop_codon:yes gene_type:complete